MTLKPPRNGPACRGTHSLDYEVEMSVIPNWVFPWEGVPCRRNNEAHRTRPYHWPERPRSLNCTERCQRTSAGNLP